MTITLPASGLAPVIPLRPPVALEPIMLCADPCGRLLAQIDGRLVHVDRCVECYDPRAGVDLIPPGQPCPTPERHVTPCAETAPVLCDHIGCHAAARADAPACAAGHDYCCGACGCQGED